MLSHLCVVPPSSFISPTSRRDLHTKSLRTNPNSNQKYDSRDYGFGEDDQSSIGPTTDDSSVTQTTGTGKAGPVERETKTGRGQGGEAENIAAVTAGTAGVDEQNSLSSYADDFADDDSAVPPPQQTTVAVTAPSSSNKTANDTSGNGDPTEQPGGGELPFDRSIGAIDASPSPTSSSESKSKARVRATGGSTGGSNRKYSTSSVANEDRDRRRPSASEKSNGATKDDVAVDFSNTGGSSGAAARDNGGKGGAATQLDASPSVRELEDRLREAALENGRLREAMKKGGIANAADGDSGRKEFEILKSQVEAAR